MKKFLIILPMILHFINSFYFDISSKNEKCFHEDFYKGTVAILSYSTFVEYEDAEHVHQVIFYFTVTDGDNKKKTHLQGIKQRGKLYFVVPENNSYTICIKGNPSTYIFRNKESVKFHLSIQTNDKVMNFHENEVPKIEDFKIIDKEITEMSATTLEIMKNQQYTLQLEDEFNEFQEKNSSNLLIFTIIQLACIVILSVWQIFSIRSLFKD